MYQVISLEQTEIYTTGDSTTHVRAYLVCDTTADLPGINDIPGYTLEMGSRALVIQGAAKYCMQSDGTWTLQQSADLQTIISTLSQVQSDISDIGNEIISINSDILTLQQKQTLLTSAIALLINDGAKNRLQITATGATVSGVQFTINADGSVTADGVNPDKKATGNIFFQLGNMPVRSGDKIHLSGCPAGGSYSGSFSFYVDYQGGSTLAYDEGSGADYTSDADRTLRCRISIRNGTVIDNLTFWPMVSPQDYYTITPDYRIYAPTNRQLFEMI